MYRILEILRNQEGFISGEELGQSLEISRAAIWKGIKRLRQEGYEIEAVTNKGYRLILHETMYNEKEIAQGLQTKTMGHPLYFYKEVTSTSDIIRQKAMEGAPEGTLAVAELQTAGRGRRGRPWSAPSGSGVWMSLLLRPEIHPTKASVLTLLMGLAVCPSLREITNLQVDIKWPNDILIDGKKLVGILTELDCEINAIRSVTIGVGINVNMKEFPEEIAQVATSLYLEGGRTFSRKQIVQKVMLCFEEYYLEFLKNGGSFAPFVAEYSQNCITLGKDIHVLSDKSFFATAMGITQAGELIVKRADTGAEEVVFSGEVSIRGR